MDHFLKFNGQIYKLSELEDETLLKLALKCKIPINHNCGGMGTCGTCRVIVRKGAESLPEPNEIEQEMINDRGFAFNERLACQTPAISDIEVELPNKKIKAG